MSAVGTVGFQARLEKGNRLQVPKPIRQRFALARGCVLKVSVRVPEAKTRWEDFYACLDKSGRVVVPKLVLCQMQLNAEVEVSSFVGLVFDVVLESD